MTKRADEYTVKLTVGDATVEVTGDRRGVVEIAKELAGTLGAGRPRLELPPGPPVIDETPSAPDQRPPAPSAGQQATNPREFFEQKRPSTMVEAAVVATYYLKELATGDQQADTIDKDSLVEIFRLAGRKLPSRPNQLLVDAFKAGFLNRVKAGAYELSNVGHNLVVHTLGSEQ
jgi:hypothetical protein